MVDAASPPPRKPAGPMRFILLGCGVLTGLMILGLGSCAGFMYVLYKGTDPIAKVGADFLHQAPELKKTLGDGFTVNRNAMGWNVQTSNDRGSARIQYTVQGPARGGSHAATVWLVKSAGAWSAVGARLVPSDGSSDTIELGKPPKDPLRVGWND